jgi:hypothetical protein
MKQKTTLHNWILTIDRTFCEKHGEYNKQINI